MNQRKKWLVGGLVISNICLLGYIFYSSTNKEPIIMQKNGSFQSEQTLEHHIETLDEQGEKESTVDSMQDNKVIQVYVCGAVRQSKVIELPLGSRVNDAVQLVGGFLEEADINQLNLAAFIEDGEKIYVPRIGETQEEIQLNTGEFLSDKGIGGIDKGTGKMNINKASLQELDQLPGIGPAIAQSIIDYRETTGGFKAIEDIKNIPKIGEKRYEQIKDLIIVK